MGGSETEAWTWWTDRKPWANSSGKASMGGCDETEATTGWTDGNLKVCEIALGQSSVGRERHRSDDRVDDGKPWEIAWGKLRWEGATRKRRQGGRTETVGKSLGSKLGWEGATRKRGHGGRTGNRGKEFGRAPLGGSNIRKRRQGGRMGNGGI